MAMTVMNNPTAMMTLGELNKNISNQSKSSKRLASGMKINSAGDDASAYAISEHMRVQLRALGQDIDNVKNGRALLKVAAGGIDNIVDELRNLKELALNAANDTNTDTDRATIQKEFDQKMANINDIASETNYNGKILLDGRYTKPLSEAVSGSGVPNEPNSAPIRLASGNITLSTDGVYTLGRGYTGIITISDSAKNIKLQQEDPTTSLKEVYIVGPSSGNANLWIENLNLSNINDMSTIRFQGSGNNLTTKGNNQISCLVGNPSYLPPVPPKPPSPIEYSKAIINIGEGLTLNGYDDVAQLNITSRNGTSLYGYGVPESWAACIGTDYEVTDGEWATTTKDIIINSGNIRILNEGSRGAGIGTGWYSSIRDIIINGGYINIQNNTAGIGEGGAAIGCSAKGILRNIVINRATIVAQGGYGAATIGCGEYGHAGLIDVKSIIINKHANITAISNGGGAGIGSGQWYSDCGDIIINTLANIHSESNADDFFAKGDDIGAGFYGTVRSIRYIEEHEGVPLVIHHGTKANQALNCYINDMRTDALGLYGTKVTTRDDAVWALSDIDAAIEYALDEATTIGSYISRLEFTEENLVTSSENTQAAESTIRDADMAKEMTEYTKSNVLAQASQSMLAQANQNASSVLSLLQ